MTSSRSFLISVALGSAILGVTVPFSWHYFSVQAYKEKLAAKAAIEAKQKAKEDYERHIDFWKNIASKIRAAEKRRRAEDKAGENPYHLLGTSPIEVIKLENFGDLELRQMDVDDVLDIYRSWLYQKIPKDQFRIRGREPFGQEKIDAAQEGTGDAAP